MSKQVEPKSISIRKEDMSIKAQKLIDDYVSDFKKEYSANINKSVAVVKLLEKYADSLLI